MMKAIGLYRYLPIENPDSLQDIELETPTATSRDLLVRVQAISVNPVDVKVRAPKADVENTPRVLGWDVAGIVDGVGPNCQFFKAGDEVYYSGTITRPGGNSQFHVVDERLVGHKPKSLSFAEAAALPLTSVTAWEALYDRLGISGNPAHNHGKSVLIIGAAGGVGSIATQLAALMGLTVIGTASRPETVTWAKQHGSDYVINHHQPFTPQLQALGFASVDYIFCLNATDKHWDAMVEVIAPQGKICSIVETHGPLNLTALQGKSATFVWELMYTRSSYQTADMQEQHNILEALAKLVDGDYLKTTVTETLSPINAANLRLAHAKIESGSTIGKIVLENFD